MTIGYNCTVKFSEYDHLTDALIGKETYQMARYITFAHNRGIGEGKTNYAIRSSDFLRAEKALTALKSALANRADEYEFGINLYPIVFDADEITPVYYVAELDGSENDREEIFEADVIPTVDDDDAELVDEALPLPTNMYDELFTNPAADEQERIEELADAINENADAWREAHFMLTVAEQQGDTKRAKELKVFMDGCIGDAYRLNAALDALRKPPTPPTVDDFNDTLADLKAQYEAAQAEAEAAEAALKTAIAKRNDAEKALSDFRNEHAYQLTCALQETLAASPDFLCYCRQDGSPYGDLDHADLYVDAIFDQFKFRDWKGKSLAAYDNPNQVKRVIKAIAEVINLGKIKFKFPTIDELNQPLANDWRTIRTNYNPHTVNLTARRVNRANA